MKFREFSVPEPCSVGAPAQVDGVACGLREWLLRLASAALPRDKRSRYLAEWIGECQAIAAECGWWHGLRFCLGLVLSAPRTGFAIRTTERPVFFDVLLVSVTLAVPASFFVGHGVISGQPVLIASYGGLLLGLVLLARGVWQNDRGLFASWLARLGLATALVSSIVVSSYQRVNPVENPALDGPFRVFPGTVLAMVGLGVFLTSGWLGEHRVTAVRAGATITGVGLTMWLVLSAANTVMVDTWIERLYHFVSIPSLVVVAYVCWRVANDRTLVLPQPA